MGQTVHRQESQANFRINVNEWQEEPDFDDNLYNEYGEYRLLRSITNPETFICEYPIVFPSKKDYAFYYDCFLWRLCEPFISKTLYFTPQYQQKLCGAHYKGIVYIEQPKYRLSDFKDIPFPDNLYCISAMLQGYLKIYENVNNAFPVAEDQVCIDRQGNISVWLNKDLSKNYPEEYQIEPHYQNIIEAESEMVKSIIKMAVVNTDSTTQPHLSFINFFKKYLQTDDRQDNNPHKSRSRPISVLNSNRRDSNAEIVTFEQALNILDEYSEHYSDEGIPQKFLSVVEILNNENEIYYRNQSSEQFHLEEHHALTNGSWRSNQSTQPNNQPNFNTHQFNPYHSGSFQSNRKSSSHRESVGLHPSPTFNRRSHHNRESNEIINQSPRDFRNTEDPKMTKKSSTEFLKGNFIKGHPNNRVHQHNSKPLSMNEGQMYQDHLIPRISNQYLKGDYGYHFHEFSSSFRRNSQLEQSESKVSSSQRASNYSPNEAGMNRVVNTNMLNVSQSLRPRSSQNEFSQIYEQGYQIYPLQNQQINQHRRPSSELINNPHHQIDRPYSAPKGFIQDTPNNQQSPRIKFPHTIVKVQPLNDKISYSNLHATSERFNQHQQNLQPTQQRNIERKLEYNNLYQIGENINDENEANEEKSLAHANSVHGSSFYEGSSKRIDTSTINKKSVRPNYERYSKRQKTWQSDRTYKIYHPSLQDLELDQEIVKDLERYKAIISH